MIHTISNFHWHASIRSYLLPFFPHSWAGLFLCPITINWTKLSRMACIWHFTSIWVHFSWTHHVTKCTIHWTMIHTISNFHWHASIRSYLLPFFPHSWTGLFLCPITINWTKLSRKACIWHFTSIWVHFSLACKYQELFVALFPTFQGTLFPLTSHNQLDKTFQNGMYLAFYIHYDPFFLDTSCHLMHNSLDN